MTVIEAAAMRCKTMADGSLRIEVEVEPRNAQAAFALFGAPGRAVALAALKDGSGAVEPRHEPQAEPAKKGGEWAKLAGMWCNDPDFWAFCNQNFTADSPMCHADHAALSLRVRCCIQSRAELDHNPEALELFQIHFRRPFMKWMISRGIQK
jgi:hypothetical protein